MLYIHVGTDKVGTRSSEKEDFRKEDMFRNNLESIELHFTLEQMESVGRALALKRTTRSKGKKNEGWRILGPRGHS